MDGAKQSVGYILYEKKIFFLIAFFQKDVSHTILRKIFISQTNLQSTFTWYW